MTRKRAPW
jgi:hypothetical protein